MSLRPEGLKLVEKLLLMIVEGVTEYKGEYPERPEIHKVLREIVCNEYIKERALDEILSGDFYREMLGEKASVLRKLSTFMSLTTGTKEWSSRIIPVGHSISPMEKPAFLTLMTIGPALGTFSLLTGQNCIDLFLNLLPPLWMKLIHGLLKLSVYKRLGLRYYLKIPVKIMASGLEFHKRRLARLIKATTPAAKLKDKFLKKLIKGNSEKHDFMVYAVVAAEKDEGGKEKRAIPLKEYLPIMYAMIPSNEIQEVWIERLPVERMKRTLTCTYENYIREWFRDYAKACKQPMLSEEYARECRKYPIGLAYRAVQNYDFWSKRKMIQDLITIASYYTLLQDMSYEDALRSYDRLINAIRKVQKGKEGDEGRAKKKEGGTKEDREQDSPKEYEISVSIALRKNRKKLELLLRDELDDERVVESLVNVIGAVKKLVDNYEKLRKERNLEKTLKLNKSLSNLLRCLCFGDNIPYIDSDVMRLGNRLFYGMDITDREWLDELTYLQTETEVYHKLRQLIPRDRCRAIKFNEVISYLAHKYCKDQPECKYCYLKRFCNFVGGRKLPTFDEILELHKN